MTYTIRHTDNSKLIELESEIIDTETVSGIGLIGYLTPNYGETQSNNFVHLVENFANYTFPENPLKGQLFYKLSSNTDGSLYLCVSNTAESEDLRWKKMPLVIVGKEEEVISSTMSFITGDMWYDTENKAFKMYDAELGKWMTVGPNDYNYTDSFVKEADGSEIEIIDFQDGSFDTKGSYLITLQVLGKEVSTGYFSNAPYSAGWKIQLLLNCYQKSASDIHYEIVGEPDYELIGTNANDWDVSVKIKNNKLVAIVYGNPSNETNSINWVSKVDLLKVK